MTAWNQFTDDQLALIGCGAALAVAFCVMALSYHVGRFVRGDQGVQQTPRPAEAAERIERRRAA